MNLKNPPGTWDTLEITHLDLWKNTGPSRAKLYVTRRAVVYSNTGAEEICRPNPTHPINRFGALWIYFWIIYWAVHDLYLFSLHRIRLDDSFGQNIINFHKIWAEYGAVKGFGSWSIFCWTHTWWKIMIFHEFEKPSWDSRTIRNHTPGPLEKHRSFASEALIWLVERWSLE